MVDPIGPANSSSKPLEFLDLYSSKNTVFAYRSAIKKFLIHVYGADFSTSELETYAAKYIDEHRSAETMRKDIEHFFVSIKSSPPKTIMTTLPPINKFLYKNGALADQYFWRDLYDKVKSKEALTRVEIPTKDELRNILMHLDMRGKTMTLILSSSGLRIGELMSLKLTDLDLKSDPVKVFISGAHTKSGRSRITFISSEAKLLLEQYLKERDELYRHAQKHTKQLPVEVIDPNDDRLFPFSNSLFAKAWYGALNKSGLDMKDNVTEMTIFHIHVLRKFFRTNFGNPDAAEQLMGHQGYLTNEYRKFNDQQLAEEYKKYEGNLWVLGNSPEAEKLKKQLGEKSEQLQTIINTLAVENADLRTRMLKLELDDQALQEELDTTKSEFDNMMNHLIERGIMKFRK